MNTLERFLNYVTIDTSSDPKSDTVPSTKRQFTLAEKLVEELKEIGISDARVDDKCYVYASLPATEGCEKAPAIGLIAHMDTTPDYCGSNVRPQVIRSYDGRDVALGDSGKVLSPEQFPHLASLKGRTLVTTDGTTLLGADDKAGIAIIMTVAETLARDGKAHGKVCFGFTPDEEIGRGADAFDIDGFGAQYAYTVDGGIETEIVYENFNACSAVFEVNGFNIHPGEAKDKTINASLVAMEINEMLPSCERPEHTEGYEGFYHLCDMQGNVEHATLAYIVRDHDANCFEARKKTLRLIEKTINEKYGVGTVKLTLIDSYRNMKEKIQPHMHLIENARTAMAEIGLTPDSPPVRGGTDGAVLSYMGLPCPNFGTGGYACHGPYEHVTAEGMDNVVRILLRVLDLYAHSSSVEIR